MANRHDQRKAARRRRWACAHRWPSTHGPRLEDIPGWVKPVECSSVSSKQASDVLRPWRTGQPWAPASMDAAPAVPRTRRATAMLMALPLALGGQIPDIDRKGER